MPIEIKELHIKIAVNQAPTTGGPQPERGGKDAEAIVAECVEQVLQILQNRAER